MDIRVVGTTKIELAHGQLGEGRVDVDIELERSANDLGSHSQSLGYLRFEEHEPDSVVFKFSDTQPGRYHARVYARCYGQGNGAEMIRIGTINLLGSSSAFDVDDGGEIQEVTLRLPDESVAHAVDAIRSDKFDSVSEVQGDH